MKKNSLIISMLVLFSLVTINIVYACTNFLVSKGASADGSTMISYAADSHVLYGELYFRPAADYPEGSMMDIYEWDTGKYLGKIKQVSHTYSVVGNMNEYQVSIGETTYGGREELWSQPGAIVDYGALIFVTLQRAKTAREAIKIIAQFMNDYGYASEGESFSISDPDEVWIMEIIGKGRNYKITQKTLDTLSGDTIPFEIVSELEKLKGKTFLKEKEFEAAVAKLIGKEEAEKYIKRFMQDAENTQRGAVWVAMKVPEGYICAHANQARITTFTYQKKNKWDDPAAIVFNAPDVITFAKQKGYYNGTDPLFSFSDVYAPVDFGGARWCEIRVWSFFKSLDSDFRKKKEYWEYVKGNVQHKVAHKEGEPLTPDNFAGNRLPLWIKPDKKVTLTQMMDAMRDHLEGTELDMRKDIGAGPFECPYRWRPLTWKVDTVVYCNERATATQQTGFSFIAQARAGLTSPVGGIFWFGVDDAASTVYVPMYCGITKVPEAYAHGNGSMMDFSFDAAFWVFNMVSNFAYTRYNVIWPEIRTKQQALEKKSIESVRDVDKKAEKLMKGGKKEEALALMTDFSVKIGNETHKEWLNLYMYLFTKYMDGNIKEKAELPENHIYVPAKLEQPGYGENWYKKIADETGDKFKVKGSAH